MRHLNRSPIHREGAAGTRRLLRRPLSRPDVPQPPFNAKARLAQGGFFAAPPFSAKAYSGIARRAGRSPSEARKLPEQKPRSPRGVRAYGKPLRANPWEWREATSPAGSSGGSAEGASEGRQPLTGPHLPPPEAAQTTKMNSPVPAGHTSRLSKDKLGFILYEAAVTRTSTIANFFPTITVISEASYTQSEALRPLIQRESVLWHCAARREITERSEEAPEAEAAQPSWNGGIWKALEG